MTAALMNVKIMSENDEKNEPHEISWLRAESHPTSPLALSPLLPPPGDLHAVP